MAIEKQLMEVLQNGIDLNRKAETFFKKLGETIRNLSKQNQEMKKRLDDLENAIRNLEGKK